MPQVALARRVGVGVVQPERIRILSVPMIPAPEDPELQSIAVDQLIRTSSGRRLTV